MLIQFVVENVLSFRDKAILSMRASPEAHTALPLYATAGGERLVRCSAIYGANASGKSNLVKALRMAQSLVIEGTPSKQRIDRIPFKLDRAYRDRPSRFELVFVQNDVQYAYGFAVDDQRVHAEWLFRGPESNEELLFQRELAEDAQGYSFHLGDALVSNPERRQFYEFLHTGTRPNQLFLHEAEERNAGELDPISAWFRDRLDIIAPNDSYIGLASYVDEAPAFREFLGTLLARTDTGIQDVFIKRTKLDPSKFTERAKESLLTFLKDGATLHRPVETIRTNEQGEIELLSLATRHHAGTDTVAFDVDEESDGTQRLMHLAPALYHPSADSAPRVFIIDEIDRSLHPLLTLFFVRGFVGESGASSGNQLVCTTHDTNLLDVDLLGAEAIWFVEKDREGASHLYSLEEFDPAQREALSKQTQQGYLAGRFGAIPFLGDPNRLRASRQTTKGDED